MNEDALRAYAEEHGKKVGEVLLAMPDIHPITAHVIASDLMSADRISGEVKAGLMKPDVAVWLVGSYARWGWAMAAVQSGHLSEDWLADNVCRLWSVSDPDDTDPDNLTVFKRMYARKGGILRDGRPLPAAHDGFIRVFRGVTDDGGAKGFAWTTDPKVAQKFANGAGIRVPVSGGRVITGRVRRSSVLAYITERGESEVIVDPRFITVTPT